MPDSRIVEVALAVVEKLAALIDPAEAIPESVFATNERLRALGGLTPPKKVRVYPVGYLESGRMARKRMENSYRIQVITEELYTDPASADPTGRVPPEWVRARVYWQEQNIYIPLNTVGVHLDETEPILDQLRPFTCETVLLYDENRLDVDKLFFSVTEVEYRETVRG